MPKAIRCFRIHLLIAVAFCAALPVGAEVLSFPNPGTKKGLQPQMIDDSITLGVKHAAINVDLTNLIAPGGNAESPRWKLFGKTFRFSGGVVAGLDAQIKPLSDRGVLVYLILLPYASGDEARNKILLHPHYAKGQKHAGPIGMFNTTTLEGAEWLVASIEFLANRYNGKQNHGRVDGYIAGNEVNSHWFWANMGKVEPSEVVSAYEKGVRLIHSAVREESATARVYVSLDHCWGEKYPGGSKLQCIPGRSFLTEFAALVRKNGDFDWHVAYHPYPEPLTDCRFWLDEKHSPQKPDAEVISFRNLEVLMNSLATEPMRWQGEPRRVILSEQGFHCSNRPNAEREQAAAYALAYAKVDRITGIDAFILHRHVDHAHEGGLKLGLWTNKPGSIADPDRKRLMYEVFQAAGTPAQPKAFEFALPVLGASSWDDAIRKMSAP